MQPWFVASALLVMATCCLGQRVEIKPLDFQPLTSLPWEEKRHRTVDEVLKRIFLEPDPEIRYPVLIEYFKLIPSEQLGRSFELCLALEGTQWPEDLVSLLLPEWARRDPMAAWARTQAMMRLMGPDWLGLDSWDRPKIEVYDRAALQASPYWLRYGIATFPKGINMCHLAPQERRAILTDFAVRYIAIHGYWPTPKSTYRWGQRSSSGELAKTFREDIGDFKGWAEMFAGQGEPDKFEIALRRWLVHTPADALRIMKVALNVSWGRHASGELPVGHGASGELLLLWSKLDPVGMRLYAESLGAGEEDMTIGIKGLLLSLVSDEKRQLWLATARTVKKDESSEIQDLLPEWAMWDPKPALAAAVATGDAEIIENTGIHAARGWKAYNSCHYGLGVVNDFDVGSLPRELRDEVIGHWGIIIMEQWGSIDIGEAARYGLKFMLATDYVPRGNLIKLFSGDDTFSSDSDMVDRTFCALRAWAVVRPEEMKAWIAKQEGEDMRKALTWLLENPWGTGSED